MPRPRLHVDNAAKQKAYRQRLKKQRVERAISKSEGAGDSSKGLDDFLRQ